VNNKFNINKNIIFALIIAIVVIMVISFSGASRAKSQVASPLASGVNDSVAVVDSIFSFPEKIIRNGVTKISDLVNTFQENKALKKKLDNYDEALLESKNQSKEIEDLKKELALNNTLTSYDKITANVISRSPDTWQDILIIDRGSKDGIEKNMAVMSQSGLVGRVIQVNKSSSKVELLTTTSQSQNNFPISISSAAGTGYGLIDHFDEKTQTLVVNQLTGVDAGSLKEGDVVQTSGLGGNSPANLAVGTVVKGKKDKDGLTTEAYVKPYAKMFDISVVTVIKRLAGEGE